MAIPSPPEVLVYGDSVAAAAAAHLLRRAGVAMARTGAPAVRVPAVMIGGATRRLFADIFAPVADPMAGLWPIAERHVRWGGAPPVVVPHQAWVLTGGECERRLRAVAPPVPGNEPAAGGDADWTVHAGGPAGEFLSFGDRPARAVRVSLRGTANPHACIAESLGAGWLFLLPFGAQEAWLLCIGEYGSAAAAVSESVLAAAAIADIEEEGGAFAAAPRLSDPLGGPGWLRCGAAAAGFDPLCGDGVGNALREAILAAAVIRTALNDSALAGPAVAHYERQLRAAMERHLQNCAAFYVSGGNGPWWRAQREACEAGVVCLHRHLEAGGAPRFRLVDFSLEML